MKSDIGSGLKAPGPPAIIKGALSPLYADFKGIPPRSSRFKILV